MNNKISILFILLGFLLPVNSFSQETYFKNKPVSFDFEIESTHETANENPFLDYRLNMIFTNNKEKFVVPGFYAADGNAANTGADKGGVWRVIFSPPFSGDWEYEVSFKKGAGIAVSDDHYTGKTIDKHHGTKGSLSVKEPPGQGTFFEKSGSLVYNNSRYLYTKNGNPLLIFGTNSPENFLAYDDIDNTYSADPDRNYIKSWEPHEKDWKKGDPTWKNGKGKGIIGALNYLASKNMNAIYLLTLNIDGDARDVWPFLSHHRKDFKRYDVSKLAQWDIIFSHAEQLGIVIEVITQEQENQLLLDDGYTLCERKLYYRELIARFSYHNNIIWNIGEENGYAGSFPYGQNDQQRYSMIRYIKENDPYKHPVLMHTYPHSEERDIIVNPLLRFPYFDGLSMQIGNVNNVHFDIKKWVETSAENRPWIILMDEIGPWQTGTKPDREDEEHFNERSTVLWPSLLAGASGVQWYFGWYTSPHDLNAENLRSRDNMWEQTAHARTFFERIDYTDFHSSDQLISVGNNHCFSKPGKSYVIYLKHGGTTNVDLRNVEGEYSVMWYNPREGGDFKTGTTKTIKSGKWENIGFAPKDKYRDWVVLIQRVK
jgi:hypothetical protein